MALFKSRSSAAPEDMVFVIDTMDEEIMTDSDDSDFFDDDPVPEVTSSPPASKATKPPHKQADDDPIPEIKPESSEEPVASSSSSLALPSEVAAEFTEEQIGMLREAYELADADGDGELTKEEWKAALGTIDGADAGGGFDAFYESVDENGDGVISFEEFVKGFAQHITWE